MTDGNIDTMMVNPLNTDQKLDTLVWIARVLAAEIRELRKDMDKLLEKHAPVERQIEAAIQEALDVLKPDVVRIRYRLQDDWSGEPSVFFNVLLSDRASLPANLMGVVEKAQSGFLYGFTSEGIVRHVYFNYRSESEQKKLNDPDWAERKGK